VLESSEWIWRPSKRDLSGDFKLVSCIFRCCLAIMSIEKDVQYVEARVLAWSQAR